MTDLVVHPAKKPLLGIVNVPSDKSMTHRALLVASIANGVSTIENARLGEDHRSTISILSALGVSISGTDRLQIRGGGLFGLSPPTGTLDCGNSGTTIRLMSGILSAMPFASTLVGDASLQRRPMSRVAVPLRLRGARIEGQLQASRPGEITLPLEIGPLPPPNVLGALAYDLPIASAQVKGALLLSGLYADGQTILTEPLLSRDHTERMLSGLGVPLDRAGSTTILDAARFSGELPAFEFSPPGDFSSAAFVLAVAFMFENSRTGVRKVGLNPTRTGFLDALRLLGAETSAQVQHVELLEPEGTVETQFSTLTGATLGGELVTRALDEIPIIAALAARATGTTVVTDAGELRVKESDRIDAIVQMLRAFGVDAQPTHDGFQLEGTAGRPVRAATIDSHGDHRIAMSAAVLALSADGTSTIRQVDSIATSFPRFLGTLRALGAEVEIR